MSFRRIHELFDHWLQADPDRVFVHLPPGAAGPEEYTEHERRNMAAAREYMEIAYDSKRASAEAVKHLVAEGASFEAHSTFPSCHDPLAYAQQHGGARMHAYLLRCGAQGGRSEARGEADDRRGRGRAPPTT